MAEEIRQKEFFVYKGFVEAGAQVSTFFEDTRFFDKVAVIINTDRAGRIEVAQSVDGTTDDYVSSFDVAAGRSAFLVDIVANYVRVRFVNTTTARATVRFGCYLKK